MVKSGRHWTRRVGGKIWKHRHDLKSVYGFAKKFGKGGSSTKTLTNNKQESLKGDDIHSGVTDWSCKINAACHKPTQVDFKSGFHQLTESSSMRIQGNPGQNYVVDIAAFGTAAQQIVTGSSASSLAENPQLATICYLDLNPNRGNTGSTQFNTVTRHNTEKIFVSSHNLKMSLANISSVGMSCWIHVVQSRVTSHSPVSVVYTKILEGEGKYLNTSAVSSIAAGAKSGGNVGYFANNGYDQFSPQSLPEFRKLYKTLKVHRVNLAGAAQEDLDFHIKHHMMVDVQKLISQTLNITNDPATWTSGNVGDVMYPQHCIQVFMVVRGGVVIDETATGAKYPTIAPAAVGWVYHKKSTVYPVKDNGQRYVTREGVVQLPTPAVADVKSIDVTDAVAAMDIVP